MKIKSAKFSRAIKTARNILTQALAFYDESQPRDENGRWGDGGGNTTYPDNDRIPKELRGKTLPDHLRVLGPKGYDEKILGNMLGQTEQAGNELQAFTDRIKETYGVDIDSAEGKALNEMGGNVSAIKDLVRNTIINDTWEQVDAIGKGIAEEVKAAGGRVVPQNPEKYAGYRGYLVNIKTSGGIMAEMQINTPEMMYAKEGHHPFTRQLIGEDRFNAIKKASGLEPGLGHKYYEQIRGMQPGPEQDAVIQKSKEYYKNFYKKLG